MHESSVASALLHIILDEVKRHEKPGEPLQVSRVVIRCGVLAAIEARTLSGCFSLLAEGTAAANASLVVQTEPMHGTCCLCGEKTTTSTKAFSCPLCGSKVDWQGGNELYIASLNVLQPGTHEGAIEN